MNQIQNEADQWSSAADYILSQSTQESDRKEYDWSLLTDFLIHNHPPYAVAEGLLACYFQLTDYLVQDDEGDHIDRGELQGGLYIMRSLYQLLQAMEEEAEIIPREREAGMAQQFAFPKEKKEKEMTKIASDEGRLPATEPLQEKIGKMKEIILRQSEVIEEQEAMIDSFKEKIGMLVAHADMVCDQYQTAGKATGKAVRKRVN